jgi:Mrp family chromosome partitioning ATPase
MKVADVDAARFEPTVFGAVRRYPIMVLAIGLLVVVAAVGYRLHAGKTYAGKASISVPSLQGSAQSVDASVLLLESLPVAQRAARIANATLRDNSLSAQDFYSSGGAVSIFPPVGVGTGTYGASVIGIAFTASNPRVAQVGANSLLQAFSQVQYATIAAQYRNAIVGIDKILQATGSPAQRSALLNQRNQQLINKQISLAQQPTIAWAIEPTSPASSLSKKTVAEGLVVGLALGAAAAYVRARRRQGFVGRQDLAALYGVPLIGEIPAFQAKKALRSNGAAARGLPVSSDPHSAVAEAFRFAAGSIERIRAERGTRLSLVFVSPIADPSKSMVVANLALAIGEGGTSVLAVDADPSEGGLTALLLPGIPASGGLEQVLAGELPLPHCIQPSPLSKQVGVLGPGPAWHAHVTGAARSKAASALFERAKSSFEVVLIDSLGLLQVADATELVGASDAAIIVLGPHEMMRDHAETVDRLNLIGSDVVGYIYDGAPMPAPLARYRRKMPTPFARYQRNGSSAHPADLDLPGERSQSVSLKRRNGSSAHPADLDLPAQRSQSVSLKRRIDSGNGSFSETPHR